MRVFLIVPFAPCFSSGYSTLTLPSWHPSIQTIARGQYNAPSYHPNIDSSVQPCINANTDEDHGSFDGSRGWAQKARHLPNEHPNLNKYFLIADPPAGMTTSVYSTHPDADIQYAAGVAIPDWHPNVSFPTGALPSTHPNVDAMLRDPANNPLPAWHPSLSDFIEYGGLSSAAVVETFTLPSWHPSIQTLARGRYAAPSYHPDINATILPCIQANTDHDHGSFDGSNGWARSPHRIPGSHPNIDNYFLIADPPAGMTTSVYSTHPDADVQYAAGVAVPDWHPNVTFPTGALPSSHPNVDAMLRDPANNPLPAWHPSISDFLVYMSSSRKRVSISMNHPNIDDKYSAGCSMPDDHPSVDARLNLPPGHSKVNSYLRNPDSHQPPTWHISLESLVSRRSLWSPGLVFAAIMLSFFCALWMTRLCLSCWENSMRSLHFACSLCNRVSTSSLDEESRKSPHQEANVSLNSLDRCPGIKKLSRVSMTEQDQKSSALQLSRLPSRKVDISNSVSLPGDANVSALEQGTESNAVRLGVARRHNSGHFERKANVDGMVTELPPPRSLGLHQASLMHAHHIGETGYEVEETRASTIAMPYLLDVYGSSSYARIWNRLTATRISRTQWSTGNAIFCLLYVVVNIVALLYGMNYSGYSFERGLGSLAAANTAFLIVPATRNNLLTWTLGLPFDHVVLYHRFLGRVTISLALLHGALYIPNDYGAYTNAMGASALACGLIIVCTTFDYVRRKMFNLFFYAHYSFIGYFLFGYLHVQQSRPFLLAGAITYALDKLLRAVWTLIPRETLLFRNRGEGIAQVRFHKNPIANALGKYKVGQYMFVNFPELSLYEWHPFSVSSAPWEPFLELHIRALGDHTKEIVELAKRCAQEDRQTWIRADGPYGVHDFDYRRYRTIVLVGGGVGITPVVGVMKELFGGFSTGERRFTPDHHIAKVICIWVVPQATEADTFLEDFKALLGAANSIQHLPSLDLRIHCTRASSGSVEAPLFAGRPNFHNMLNEANVGSVGNPSLIFACGPGMMVNGLWDEANKRAGAGNARVDFHHETFEF